MNLLRGLIRSLKKMNKITIPPEAPIKNGLITAGFTASDADKVLNDLSTIINGNAVRRLVSYLTEADRVALNKALAGKDASEQEEIIAQSLERRYSATVMEETVALSAHEAFGNYFRYLIKVVPDARKKRLTEFCVEAGLL